MSTELQRLSETSGPPVVLPQLNAWILLRELGSDRYVVKNQRTHSYYQAGPEEYFLLDSLRVPCTLQQLQRRFFERFQEELECCLLYTSDAADE